MQLLDEYGDPVECLDAAPLPLMECEGAIEYRMPLSATGKSFPRCDRHWLARLDKHERDQERIPDSDIPPDWFDPAAAGERWNEDD